VSFATQLAADAARLESALSEALADLPESQIAEAMRYSLRGGKRLRGFLVLESARMFGVAEDRAIWPAMAIEALHAYSLVHDDMPCMDDDDLRRGRSTVHVKWDEATAVLAGDALQAVAMEWVSQPEIGSGDVRADLAFSLARASGARGMVLGQALDIAAESAAEPLTLDQITALQAGKTGALFEWSACAGARLAGAGLSEMKAYASALGLAFQIADDILDVTGDAAKAGKRLQKDAEAGKATFVSLLGLEGARARATELVDAASAALDPFGPAADNLRAAARFVMSRET